MWEALATWPQPGEDGRKWPPQMQALAALARRHPEEYRELLAEVTPLVVVFDPWLPG
jgi:hypothetical protein